MSGVGKGIAASSIGKIMQARGFKVTALKIDPYVNVDAGTMNPTEHGEVFVLSDGTECDQDMGNYERFLECELTSANYITTGSIYQRVIEKERNLEYQGKCVEVVPHIPLEVIDKIENAAKLAGADIVITEIGGTIGEYQNILFLEAVRMMKLKSPGHVATVLVSFLPLQGKDSELKTKPTQYAVRSLNSAGIQPDIIIARASVALDKKRKEKIAFNCNMEEADVISAPNVENIYEVPLNFEREKLSAKLVKKLNLESDKTDLKSWKTLVRNTKNPKKTLQIGIVGKYFGTGNFTLADSYISVIEAIRHGAQAKKVKAEITWVDSSSFDPKENKSWRSKIKSLNKFDGILVPGGFGSRGVEGKIKTIQFARENKIPYLGLCYGMQLAVVEYSRNVAGLNKAHTVEVHENTPHPVIAVLPEQELNIEKKRYGGTMRLGTYKAVLKEKTLVHGAYKKSHESKSSTLKSKVFNSIIDERHRHRYEVNPEYVEILEKNGLTFSGTSEDKRLMEIIELPTEIHPFFVATQFHPEFKSKPLSPHPIFESFINASIESNKIKLHKTNK